MGGEGGGGREPRVGLENTPRSPAPLLRANRTPLLPLPLTCFFGSEPCDWLRGVLCPRTRQGGARDWLMSLATRCFWVSVSVGSLGGRGARVFFKPFLPQATLNPTPSPALPSHAIPLYSPGLRCPPCTLAFVGTFAQHRLTRGKPPWKPSQQNTRKKANQVTAHPCSFTAPGKGKKKKKGKKGGRGDEKGKKGGKKKNLHDSPPHAARSLLLSPPLPPSRRLAPFVPTPCTPCLGDLGDLHPNSTGSK